MKDIQQTFDTEFHRMTTTPIDIGDLEKARTTLIEKIISALTPEDKQFLVQFKEGNPNWKHISVPHIQTLPAIKWKLHNLDNMKAPDRLFMINELKKFFGM